MKKDLKISETTDVYIAVVHDYNETFKVNDWNVYLINDKDIEIEMALILSKGFDDKKETSIFRHKVDLLPAKSGVKIEFMQDEVLTLNNEFKVTFFANNKLFEKTYLFKKNSIKISALRMLKVLNKRGVLMK